MLEKYLMIKTVTTQTKSTQVDWYIYNLIYPPVQLGLSLLCMHLSLSADSLSYLYSTHEL